MSENKKYEIQHIVFEVETFPYIKKRQVFKYIGDPKNFDFRKYQKRMDDLFDKGYVMRCCLAAFCYGVYVRLLF